MKTTLKDLKDAAVDVRKSTPKSTFKNEYGEKFTIYSNGTFVLMEGDEVNAMVDNENAPAGLIGLFNEHFNVWSSEELLLLGAALQDVAQQNINASAK